MNNNEEVEYEYQLLDNEHIDDDLHASVSAKKSL
jgi:hypothetical protein